MLETKRSIVEICQDYSPRAVDNPWRFPKRNITGDSFDFVLGVFIILAGLGALFLFGWQRIFDWIFGPEK